MLKYSAAILMLFTLTCCSTSQEIIGSGKIVNEKRSVRGFNKVVVSGTANVYLSQTDEESLTIVADDNIINYISSEVGGDTLHIDQKMSSNMRLVKTSKPINYYITVKDLKEISLLGSGNVATQGPLNVKDISITINGAVTGNVEVNAHRVTTDLSGSAEFTIKGQADSQEINISGTGNYNGAGLICKIARVDVSGLGKVVVNAEDNLIVRISGAGSIFYIGKPKVQETISGSGRLEQIEKKEK